MAEVTRPARRTRRRAEAETSGGKQQAEEQAPQEEPQDEEQAQSNGSAPEGDDSKRGDATTLMSELRSAIRDAAIDVLKPVAREATSSAAKFAVSKGPDMVKDKVVPKVAEAGGAGAMAKGVLDKGGGVAGGIGELAGKVAGKGKGGKKPTGHGRGRRLPVQQHVDVAVDLQTAYDQFTQFEDWPQFMHRVEKVEQRDDATVMFHENIWGIRRSWEAEIVEQKPCERIVWRSKGPLQTIGVATFHRLSDNLTRVQVNMDFQPKGLFEKTASGMRMSRRALRSDLMRFRAFVEMSDEATGAWRGTIEEGEVTESPEDAEEGRSDEGQEREGEEPEASEDDDVEEDERDQPEASQDDDYEDDYDEDAEPTASSDEPDEGEPEDEEQPAPTPPTARRRRTRTTTGSTGSRRR